MKDNLFYFIAAYGEEIGLGILLGVSVYDLLLTGARGFFEYSISCRGVVMMWCGIALVVASKHLDKTRW